MSTRLELVQKLVSLSAKLLKKSQMAKAAKVRRDLAGPEDLDENAPEAQKNKGIALVRAPGIIDALDRVSSNDPVLGKHKLADVKFGATRLMGLGDFRTVHDLGVSGDKYGLGPENHAKLCDIIVNFYLNASRRLLDLGNQTIELKDEFGNNIGEKLTVNMSNPYEWDFRKYYIIQFRNEVLKDIENSLRKRLSDEFPVLKQALLDIQLKRKTEDRARKAQLRDMTPEQLLEKNAEEKAKAAEEERDAKEIFFICPLCQTMRSAGDSAWYIPGSLSLTDISLIRQYIIARTKNVERGYAKTVYAPQTLSSASRTSTVIDPEKYKIRICHSSCGIVYDQEMRYMLNLLKSTFEKIRNHEGTSDVTKEKFLNLVTTINEKRRDLSLDKDSAAEHSAAGTLRGSRSIINILNTIKDAAPEQYPDIIKKLEGLQEKRELRDFGFQTERNPNTGKFEVKLDEQGNPIPTERLLKKLSKYDEATKQKVLEDLLEEYNLKKKSFDVRSKFYEQTKAIDDAFGPRDTAEDKARFVELRKALNHDYANMSSDKFADLLSKLRTKSAINFYIKDSIRKDKVKITKLTEEQRDPERFLFGPDIALYLTDPDVLDELADDLGEGPSRVSVTEEEEDLPEADPEADIEEVEEIEEIEEEEPEEEETPRAVRPKPPKTPKPPKPPKKTSKYEKLERAGQKTLFDL